MKNEPLRILVVEDDPDNSGPLESLLKKKIVEPLRKQGLEAEIILVETMQSALAHAPMASVTILDLELPDSTRDESIEQIHSFRPPVIVVTGNDEPDLLARCKMAGADHVFVKGQIYFLCEQVLDSMMKHIVITSGMTAYAA